MDDIIKEEIERWLDRFETDVVAAVEYFRKCSKYNFTNWMVVSRLRQYSIYRRFFS
jgi:hypothetical protein